MSTTTSPSSSGSADIKAESLSEEPGVARINISAESEQGIRYQLIPAAGKCPVDEPFWVNHANLSPARGLQPLTIRLLSNQGGLPNNFDNEDKVRNALWRKIRQLFEAGEPCNAPLPSIIFGQTPMAGGSSQGVIDLPFASTEEYQEAYNRIDKVMDSIRISGFGDGDEDEDEDDDDEETHIYKYECSTNSLDGSVIVIECLGLPISRLDAEEVMAAFDVMAGSLGSILGIARIALVSRQWGIHRSEAGVVRIYLQLASENMTSPWEETISILPTHFVCNGVPYGLRYRGVKLHKEDVLSTDFNIPVRHAQVQKDRPSASSDKRARPGTEAADSSSTAVKKATSGAGKLSSRRTSRRRLYKRWREQRV